MYQGWVINPGILGRGGGGGGGGGGGMITHLIPGWGMILGTPWTLEHGGVLLSLKSRVV